MFRVFLKPLVCVKTVKLEQIRTELSVFCVDFGPIDVHFKLTNMDEMDQWKKPTYPFTLENGA